MPLQANSSFLGWEKLMPRAFSESFGSLEISCYSFVTSKGLVFHCFAIENDNNNFSFHLCAYNNVSVLVRIPESRPWDRDLGISSLFGRWPQEKGVMEQGEWGRQGGKANEGWVTEIPAGSHGTSEKCSDVSQNCSSERWQVGLSIHWLPSPLGCLGVACGAHELSLMHSGAMLYAWNSASQVFRESPETESREMHGGAIVPEGTACAEVSTPLWLESEVGSFTPHLPSVITRNGQSGSF